MKIGVSLVASIVCVGVSTSGAYDVSASASDVSSMYDQATLQHWQPRYQRSTMKIVNEVIVPVLTSEERRRLGVATFDFPLYADGELKRHPLMFYVPGDPRVVMPIFSLKFLDDLCTAYAWLQVNGYSLETISEYNAMLRYRGASGGRYPAPLPALDIPTDALKDRRVDELALGHFVTARTWLLLHELGHIYGSHRRTSNAQSRKNEQEADRFAMEVMRRTPLPPLGILVFFLADAHWTGYPSSDADTHPLSGARLRTLASGVNDRGLATGLSKLAELLDDPEIRAGFAATARAADASSLGPRRPGELPRLASAASARNGATGGHAVFEGRYVGESLQFSDNRPFPIQVALRRRGDRVEGQYSFGLGVGIIENGVVAGNTLTFSWRWAENFGRGTFKANGDGFSGTWGYGRSATNAGTWTGRRVSGP
jgi:hypothetical protein